MNRPRNAVSSPRSLLFTLLAGLIVYVAFAADTELWDRDEPRFARCAIEMIETGDFLVPRFNGEVRPDKPALIYWLMVLSEGLLGRSELAFRLPSILGTLLTAVFTFLIGRRLYDSGVGALAAAMWLGAITPFYIGTVATADGVMLAFLTAGLWLLTMRVTGHRARWHLPVAVLILGGGLLTKGPVALAVPLLGLLGYALLSRGSGQGLDRATVRGAGLATLGGILLFVAWGIPANIASENVLLKEGIGRHVLGRMVEPQEGHGGEGALEWFLTLPLHVPLMLTGLFPWTGLLIPALAWAWHERRLPATRLLLGWSLPTFILMSVVVTKLPHYTLPIFPALVVVMAAWVHRAQVRGPASERAGRIVGALFGVVIGLALAYVGWQLGSPLALTGGVLGALIAFAAVGLTFRLFGAPKRRLAARGLAFCALGLGLVLDLTFSPAIERETKASDEVCAAIADHAPRDIPVVTWGYGEPSLVYYLNQTPGSSIRGMRTLAPTIAEWARLPGPGVLVTSQQKLAKENRQASDIPAEVIFEREVINTASSMRRTDLVVFLK